LVPGGPLREEKKLKGSQVHEETTTEGVVSVKRKWLEGQYYCLGGVSSGFIQKRAKGELIKRSGILARTWAEWITVETAFNLELEWICLQESTFFKALSSIYPKVKIIFWQTGVVLRPVEYLFFSQWPPPESHGI
jgi:hypothetical protein